MLYSMECTSSTVYIVLLQKSKHNIYIICYETILYETCKLTVEASRHYLITFGGSTAASLHAARNTAWEVCVKTIHTHYSYYSLTTPSTHRMRRLYFEVTFPTFNLYHYCTITSRIPYRVLLPIFVRTYIADN